MVDGRHEDQVATGQRDVARSTRAPLVPIGSLATWTMISWPSLTRSSMRARRAAASRLAAAFAARLVVVEEERAEILGRAAHVGHVQERGLLDADVDEGRLHARKHALTSTFVDVADDAALAAALDVQLDQLALFDQRDPGLGAVSVDNKKMSGHKSLCKK